MNEPLQFAFDEQDKLQQRLDAVLQRGEGPWPLPENARKMLEWLSFHKGAKRAIKGDELAARLKCNVREVKAIAKTLTEDFGVPIGASRTEPYGYFLIETAEELSAVRGIYLDEMRSLARRVRALDPEAFPGLFGQLELELKEQKA